jgi:hypothetical protein
MNMFNRFEYNSNSSCHFLRGKKQNFPFFFLRSHTHSLALLVEKKKRERKECIEVVLPAAAIFFCDYPFCRTERRVNEKKKEKKTVEFMHQTELLLTFVVSHYIWSRKHQSYPFLFSNIDCLCLEKRQLWYFFYWITNKSCYHI